MLSESLTGRYFPSDPLRFQRKAARSILAFCWLLELISGISLAFAVKDPLCSLMRGAFICSVSIVWMICVSTLPFLLSTIVVYLSSPVWLFLICFCKAYLFAFAGAVIIFSCGSAGWLIKYLLLFHDFACIPVLYLFWIRGLTGRPQPYVTAGVGGYVLLTGISHVCVISPYFASLLKY